MSENNDISDKMIGSVVHGIKSNVGPFPLEEDEMYTDMGKELSDQMIAAQKAAYEAGEDKPEFVGTPKGDNILKDTLDGKIPKPPSLADMLRDQLDAGADRPDLRGAKKYMDHIHELFEKNKGGIEKLIEELGADEPWSLTKAEEAELTELLKPLGEFITKHELPAVIRIQTGRSDGFEAKLVSLKCLPLIKVCPRLGLLIKMSDILFSEALQKEEYEALMDLVFRISMAQRLRGEE